MEELCARPCAKGTSGFTTRKLFISTYCFKGINEIASLSMVLCPSQTDRRELIRAIRNNRNSNNDWPPWPRADKRKSQTLTILKHHIQEISPKVEMTKRLNKIVSAS